VSEGFRPTTLLHERSDVSAAEHDADSEVADVSNRFKAPARHQTRHRPVHLRCRRQPKLRLPHLARAGLPDDDLQRAPRLVGAESRPKKIGRCRLRIPRLPQIPHLRAVRLRHARARPLCTSLTADTSKTSASMSSCAGNAGSSLPWTVRKTATSPSTRWAPPSAAAAWTLTSRSRSASMRFVPIRRQDSHAATARLESSLPRHGDRHPALHQDIPHRRRGH
jgi:hypothetical protein